MIEVKLKIGGSIFVETFGDSEEPERIKIFDSKKQYLEYITIERIINTVGSDDVSILIWIAEECQKYANASDIHNLLALVDVESYTVSKEWTDLIEDAAAFCNEGDNGKISAMTKEEFLDSEYINVIGEHYIIQTGF